MASRRRPQLTTAAAWVVVLGYGWWLTGLQPFTGGALLAVLGVAAALVVVATVRRIRRTPTPVIGPARSRPGFRAAVVVWSAIAAAVTAWELQALRSSPRSAHPTISSLVETAEHHHLARLALYAAWILLGWVLAS